MHSFHDGMWASDVEALGIPSTRGYSTTLRVGLGMVLSLGFKVVDFALARAGNALTLFAILGPTYTPTQTQSPKAQDLRSLPRA